MSVLYNPTTPTGAHRNVISVLKKADIVPSMITDDVKSLSELLAGTIKAFDQEIRLQGVAIVYLYDAKDQKQDSPLRSVDGINLKHERRGVSFHSIGIETRSIHRHDAEKYVPALFLHELAHCSCGPDHDDAFENQYNELLVELNKRTGLRVKNDYAGYEPDKPTEIRD